MNTRAIGGTSRTLKNIAVCQCEAGGKATQKTVAGTLIMLPAQLEDKRWSTLLDAHGELTCYIDCPIVGSPIGLYPCARPGAAGNVSPHAATADDNPASASGPDTKIEECLAGLFYRRLCRRQWD